MSISEADVVARARAAAAIVAPMAERIERDRRLPPEALDALVEAGALKMFLPQEYGGAAASLATGIAVVEEIARADGSAGWCTMVAASSSLMCGYLPDDEARAIFGPADAVTSGVFAPMGRAQRVDGGYRVSGRWPFASGCEHAQWRMGGAIVEGDPLLSSGAPDVRSLVFRAEDTRVLDTWNTFGLRGTGSHDLEVTDVFVPASRSFSLVTQRPRFATGAFAAPFFGALAAMVAAVGLGIARGALDAFGALASAKRPQGSKRTVAHREIVQLDFARADARWRAARAGLERAVADLECSRSAAPWVEPDLRPGARGDHDLDVRARLRASACHAASESAAVVDIVYEAAGASAIYTSSPLQRQFRDAHVVTQHLMVATPAMTLAGRVLLGVAADVQVL